MKSKFGNRNVAGDIRYPLLKPKISVEKVSENNQNPRNHQQLKM